jgi:serine/threonine protein kinase
MDADELINLSNLCLGCMRNKGVATVCPHCGFAKETNRSPLLLPYLTVLNQKFFIGRVLGNPGGFGITYLAWDSVLHTAVAIKEYMPSGLASREASHSTIIPHSMENQAAFEYGLDQFLREARTLAQFKHPHIVRIREFFRENNTAYLVMDYYDGISLDAWFVRQKQKITEAGALKIMLPILEGLNQVHEVGVLHRDIKPANIYLVNQQEPLLLDFGAARYAIGQKSLSLSVILTPGFAPFEQYLSRSQFTPATDIYACAATLYYLVSGIRPHEATDRFQRDETPPIKTLVPTLSPHFAKAITDALSVQMEARPQTVAEFRAALLGEKAIFSLQSAANTNQAQQKVAINQSASDPPLFPVAVQPNPVKQEPAVRRYVNVYCPHCKAKNVITEGKPLSKIRCSRCGKLPTEKINSGFSVLSAIKLLAVIAIIVLAKRFFSDSDTSASLPTKTPLNTAPTPATNTAFANDNNVTLPPPPPSPPSEPEKPTPSSNNSPRNWENKKKPSPPQFAFQACYGKQEQQSCIVPTPQKEILGRCEKFDEGIACIPNGE